MKILFSLFILSFVCTALFAQTSSWKADPMHSQLGFSITHLGISDVDGVFKKFDATATGSAADFSDAIFEFTTDVSSIDTDVDMCNKHLRSADFFDVEKFPTMTKVFPTYAER
ncbi:YceI family protein [Pedobacter sp.]|uniref:YceI family protein n=1 Tax=Pedobacter sp. TaxID=1411316 RepID=UPI003D7F4BEA